MKKVTLESFQQMESAECGAASLKIILSFYNSYISIQTAKKAIGIGRDGSSGRQICAAAAEMGLSLLPLAVSFDEIMHEVDPPYIMFWGANHWLVVEGFDGGYLYVSDPAKGRVRYDQKTAASFYSDFILYPTDFNRSLARTEKVDPNSNLYDLLRSYRSPLIVASILSIFSLVPEISISLLLGYFAQLVATDSIDFQMVGGSWFLLMVTGLFAIFAFTLLLIYRLINKNLVLYLSRSVITRLLKAPLLFFSVRSTGELGSRVVSISRNSALISGSLIPGSFSILRAVFAIITCLFIDLQLGLFIFLVFTSSTIYVSLLARTNIRDSAVSDIYSSKCFGILVDIIRSSELVKSTGTESSFFQNWASNFSQYLTASQSIASVNAGISTVISGSSFFLTIGLLFLSALSIMNGNMNLATYTALLYITTIVTSALNSVPNTVTSFSTILGFKWRLNDLIDLKDDQTSSLSSYENLSLPLSLSPSPADKIINSSEPVFDALKLESLHLNNLSFSYPGSEISTFSDLNIEFPTQGITSIVGPSGCGKSTLVKIISGLIPQGEGMVTINRIPLHKIPNNIRYKFVCYVSQDPFLFEGSLFDNITLNDASITRSDVEEALDVTGLIDKLKISSDTSTFHVKARGINLSGGQRQLIEMTRALARKPKLLILDEATSGFDNQLESFVLSNLLKREMCILSIAHRQTALNYSSSILDMSDFSLIANKS